MTTEPQQLTTCPECEGSRLCQVCGGDGTDGLNDCDACGAGGECWKCDGKGIIEAES